MRRPELGSGVGMRFGVGLELIFGGSAGGAREEDEE